MAPAAVQQDAEGLNGTNSEALDVCIVGAGPAGLMLA
jgi:NADPH-dependent 2,4-dienoyl-CoA reductase/sulfur reductase-like enzyme